MKRVLCGLIALVLSLCAAEAARADTLANLIANNGSIIQGDKLFDNFSYSATGDMPTAANINVIGVTVDGNFGVRFQGAFMDSAGGGASDAPPPKAWPSSSQLSRANGDDHRGRSFAARA